MAEVRLWRRDMSGKMRKDISWTAFHDKPIIIFSRRFCSQEEAKRSFKKCIKSWNFVKRQSHKQSDVFGILITVYSMDCSQKTEAMSASQWCQMVIQEMVCEYVLQKPPAILYQNSYLLSPEIFVFLTSCFSLNTTTF